jgi:uncharacterized protein
MPTSKYDPYAIAVALVLPSLITWAYFFQADSATVGIQLLLFNVVKTIQFLFPAVWTFAVQRRPFHRPRASWEGIPLGVATGLAIALAMAALYGLVVREADWFAPAADAIRQKISGFGIDSRVEFIALGLFYSLIHSLLEEYYWRWFVYGQLRQQTSFRWAVALSSVGFMAHHILVLGKFFGFAHPATWIFSGCVAVGGILWAWLYERSGSLGGPWVSHLVVDAAIFTIGYDLARPLFAAGV